MRYSLILALALAFDIAASACPITPTDMGVVGNAALAAYSYGKFVFEPGGSGFVDHDGALGIKFAWERYKPGLLHVGGRRLDGPAAFARAYISNGYGDVGFQPTYLIFPTPGCWEITGFVGDLRESAVTFVMLVEKVGDGPEWRLNGPQRNWRVTSW